MPYLHCPQCRLTLYKPRALAGAAESCPRCGARLGQRPRRLFGARAVAREGPSAVKTPPVVPPAAR